MISLWLRNVLRPEISSGDELEGASRSQTGTPTTVSIYPDVGHLILAGQSGIGLSEFRKRCRKGVEKRPRVGLYKYLFLCKQWIIPSSSVFLSLIMYGCATTEQQ